MSETPQKKMVSSIYITLATPARATAPAKEVATKIEQDKSTTMKQTEMSTLNRKEASPLNQEYQNLSDQKYLQDSRKETNTVFPPADSTLLNGDFLPPPLPPPPSFDNTSKTSDLGLLPPPPPPVLSAAALAVTTNSSAKPDTSNSQIHHSLAPTLSLQKTNPTPVGLRTQQLPSTSVKQEDVSQSQIPNQSVPKQPNILLEQATVHSKGLRSSCVSNSQASMMEKDSWDICGFCHKTIALSCQAIEAMNKLYHTDCFTCRLCHIPLAGLLYYSQNGRPMCDPCYKDTLEKCAKCEAVIEKHIVRAMGQAYHPECFTCVVCHKHIKDEQFALNDQNEAVCAEDFYRAYAPVCCVCQEPIIPKNDADTYTIECLGQTFHESCYRCEKCGVFLSPEPTEKGCYPLKNHILCKSCNMVLRMESVC
ncbi:filamin-binding LIM protein 1 [Protopterus annectens]|uniref:filamin-binding LIM protein 1 n=1 Tax=Protopterus annectens TaxID=7888 RepID=UPI001CF99A51|nr:filamin-binding LIM protein 1 [Protopterus annectens]